MELVKGNVASKSRKGNSIKVGDDWYSTFKSSDLDHVNWKDDVEFMYEQKGKYRNIKGRVEVTSAGGSSGGSGSAPRNGGGSTGFSNLGVELGHASNLAMRMMEQSNWDNEDVGSAAYFAQFVKYTEDMYKVMQAVRGNISGDTPVKESKSPKPTKDDLVEEDIF